MPITDNAMEILRKRYFLPDETTAEQMFMRVAEYISLAEKEEDREFYKNTFFEMMNSLQFLPSSPCLTNAGHPTRMNQLSSCFIVPLEDSMEEIMDSLKWQALITKSGGGTGFSFSKLRPNGAEVKGVKGMAGGPVCFMRVFDANTEAVKQNLRRGANMGSLHIWHPSIEEFIDCKKDLNEFNNFNITVSVTDDFMKAVEEDADYDLVFNGKVYKTVKARYLWDKIINNAWATGEPGIEFIDIINRDNPVPHLGDITSSNPCHEYVFIPWGSCNLGSIKLSACVVDGKFNYITFKELIYSAVRFIDNMITMNELPLPQLKYMALKTRPIGLGVMDFAGALIKMGIPYDSKEGLEFASKISKFMNDTAEEASMVLAEEKGVFPEWKDSVWGKKNQPMRNSTLLSIAPTGTISIIADCSSGGIEPIYAIAYKRRVVSMQDMTLTFCDKLFEETAKARGFYSEELIDKIVETGSCQNIKEVPEDIKRLFKTANEISPEQHLRMQAAWQDNVDLSISKCVAKGTLVQTNKGVLPIEELGCAKGADVFANAVEGLQIKDEHGNWQNVIAHYSGGIKPTKKIRLDNGHTLEGSCNHRIKTIKGWKRLEELKVGDLVLTRQEDYGNREGGLSIEPVGFKGAYNNAISIPLNMSQPLALWLGMIMADGFTTESTGAVGLTTDNDEVENLFVKLSKEIFRINKIRVTRDLRRSKTRSIIITSRTLVMWVEKLIGKGAWNKYIPSQIMQGSVAEQRAFLSGVSLDGYIKEEKAYSRIYLTVYEGRSGKLAEQIYSLCCLLGQSPYFVTKKVYSPYDGFAYGVVVDNNFFMPIDRHKRLQLTKRRRKVLIPFDVLGEELKKNDPNYTTWRKWKRKNAVVTYSGALDRRNVEYDRNILCCKVTSIQEGCADVYDIEVEGNHTYLVNGIVTHNTINVPNNATREDISNAYKLAHELGIKGVAVYRNGCRDNVLVAGEQIKKNDIIPFHNAEGEEIALAVDGVLYSSRDGYPLLDDEGYSYVRPSGEDKIPALIRKVKTGCGRLETTISYDEEDNWIEIRTHSKGGCQANIESISRLVSICRRGNINPEVIIDQLNSAFCKHCYEKTGNKSCGGAIGNVIQEFIDEQDDMFPTFEGEIKGFSEDAFNCPECGQRLIFVEGCMSCTCGYSKCN